MATKWGYKPTGEACLFDLPDGVHLPAGWSADYKVILKPEHQTAEHISEAAGPSTTHPVKVGHEIKLEPPAGHFPADFHRDPTPRQEATKPEVDEQKRGPGRPPLPKG